MLRQLSVQAYHDIQEDGTAATQRLRILKFVRKFPDGLTRNEISRLLNIKINAVCGRCRELIILRSVYEDGKKKDQFSLKENYVLKASRVIEVTQ